MKIALLGSAGHAGVIVDAIEALGEHEVIGYLDDTIEPGASKRGYPVIGRFADWELVTRGGDVGLVLAFGDNFARREIARSIQRVKFPVVRHPAAVTARSAEIGRGTVLLSSAHVGPGSKVGEFCVLNTGASLDHDAKMCDYSSLGPGTFTGGLVEIGECSATGVGVSISDRVSIGPHSVVGTGAVVVRDIPGHSVAYGNPARVIRQRKEGEPYVASNPRLVQA
jgi:sugar O-acyltransferase (sialic acid O-acetyltransferase NeuD family)